MAAGGGEARGPERDQIARDGGLGRVDPARGERSLQILLRGRPTPREDLAYRRSPGHRAAARP
jgi:hypothetical protein